MNITLRISDELGKRAKHFAVDEGKSLSAIVAELLEKQLENMDNADYRKAQDQAWALMQEGLPGASEDFVRDELYGRGNHK